MNLKNCHYLVLPVIPDGVDGKLCVAESLHTIPFEIKRIYYIYDLENEKAIRGRHAHRTLEQVIFCINGSFILELDDGNRREQLLLNKRNIGIYLGVNLWHTMTQFSKDCLLLVFASDYYNESDYIRNYGEFLKHINTTSHDSAK